MMKRQKRSTFTSEKDKMLIEYVRENEELYDFSHKKYSDTLHKAKLWVNIGEKLQLDSKECKRRWEALRGQYRKYLRFKKTVTGQAATKNTKWKYEEILDFLKSHFKDKQRISSIDIETDEESEDGEELSQADLETSQAPDADGNPDCEVIIREDPPLPITPSTKPKRRIINNKIATQTSSASGTLMNYLLEEEKKKKKKTETEKDEIDYFFEGIKATVKTFNAADKHSVKNKIFMAVSDIEGKYVGQQQPNYHHYPPNPINYHNMQNNMTTSTYNNINPQHQTYSLFQSCQPPGPASNLSIQQQSSAQPSTQSSAQSSSSSSYLDSFSPQSSV